jgi:imidazoleglycerol-phosphate dehydratase
MRRAIIQRKTKETHIRIELALDGSGKSQIDCPINFFSHMLETFARHGSFDLRVWIRGDLKTDAHHTIEDTGLALGMAFEQALGQKKGISRAGFFAFPMDEALALAAVDLSGRPYLKLEIKLRSKKIGDFVGENLEDFFSGFASALRASFHLKVCYGRSDHHKVEALFKSLARAMRQACSLDKRLARTTPSTKEVL